MFAWKKLTGITFIFLLVALFAFGTTPTLAQAPVATATKTSAPVSASPVVTATTTVTPTATTVPPTATKVVTASTATPVPPTATKVMTPSTATPVLPTATKVVTAPTATLVPPTATKVVTATAVPATPTKTTVPPTATATRVPTRAAAPRAPAAISLSTAFVVQNTDHNVTATVTADFYGTTNVAVSSIITSVAPNRSVMLDQRDSDPNKSGLIGVTPPFTGSAVLSSNTQLAAVVTEYTGNAGSQGTGFSMDAYTGLAGTRASAYFVLSQLYKDVYDPLQNKRYNSMIVIQNTNLSASVNVTITYYGMTAPNTGTYVHPAINIPGGASKVIDLSSSSSEPYLPTSPADLIFLGAGTVTADPGGQILVIASHYANGSLLTQHGSTSADAATTMYFPQLYSQVTDPLQGYIFGSSVQVMKPDPTDITPVTVTLTYFNSMNGRTTSQMGKLDGTTKKLNFDQRFGGVDFPFYGSATLVATAPVIATANIVTNFTSLGGRALTYRAVSAATGSTNVFVPLLMKGYYDPFSGVNYSTAFQGRLTNGGSATVAVTFYYTEGGVPKQYTLPPININSGTPSFTVDQRPAYAPYLPDGVVASAWVSSTAPIGITVNMVGASGTPGDGSGTFDGVGQ